MKSATIPKTAMEADLLRKWRELSEIGQYYIQETMKSTLKHYPRNTGLKLVAKEGVTVSDSDVLEKVR